MLSQIVTHSFPWDESDEFALCGARLAETDVHMTQPTCAACQAALEARELALEAEIEGAA